MKSVKVFFDKFNNTALKEISKRTIISEIIKREAKVLIPIESISFISNGIKLKLNPTEKNQVFIKKEKIIKLISNKIPNLIIKEIN
jgi:hypothetical protein